MYYILHSSYSNIMPLKISYYFKYIYSMYTNLVCGVKLWVEFLLEFEEQNYPNWVARVYQRSNVLKLWRRVEILQPHIRKILFKLFSWPVGISGDLNWKYILVQVAAFFKSFFQVNPR